MVFKRVPSLKAKNEEVKANYDSKQVNETEHALNSVPDDFDITTCKN